MNMEQMEGKWEQLKGMVREKWGKLTDDDIATVQGKAEQLQGKLRERYGYSKEEAEKEIKSFMQDCNCDTDSKARV